MQTQNSDNEDIESLLAIAAREQHKRMVWGCSLWLACPASLVIFIKDLLWTLPDGNWEAGLKTVLAALATALLFKCNFFSRSHIQALKRLAVLDDVRVITPLAQAFSTSTDSINTHLIPVLTRLLQQIGTDNASTLTPDAQKALVRYIRFHELKKNPELVFAILSAAKQAGGEALIPAIISIIIPAASTPQEQQVQQQARECLPLVIERLPVEDVTEIGALSRAFYTAISGDTGSERQASIPAAKLMKLLPRLNADNLHLLSQRDREALYKTIYHAYHSMLICTDYLPLLLKAIQRCNDTLAFQEVESVARYAARRSKQDDNSPLLEAAQTCRDHLAKLMKQEEISKTLVRGSSAPPATGETLLRVAQSSDDTAPQMLLRAANSDDSH